VTSELSARQRAALAFTDDFLANTRGSSRWLNERAGFTAAQVDELTLGLGLFHGFSKVLIALGCEPEPGSMSTTELPTPDATEPWPTLADGRRALLEAIAAAVPIDVRTVAHERLNAVLGADAASNPELAADSPAGDLDAALAGDIRDVVDLFVVDAHAISDEHVEALNRQLGPSVTVGLFIGLAVWDTLARTSRAMTPV
jgi:hypothetical protein